MTMLAQKCFNENLALIGRDHTGTPKDPLAWNLNQGLLDLARALQQLQRDVSDLQQKVNYIQAHTR